MPFTVTHIAAILPFSYFASRNLLFSALAIGSMIPDIAVFVPAAPDYALTHSVAGIFLACVPLGVATFLLFQMLLKPAFYDLMPIWIRQRLVEHRQPLIEPNLTFFVKVSLAVALGAATHLIWDAFTHSYGWGVRMIPALAEHVMTLYGFDLTGYKIGQYGSTLVGLSAMAVLLTYWLRNRSPQSAEPSKLTTATRRVVGCLLVFLPLASGLIRAGLINGWPADPQELRGFVFTVVQTTMFAFVLVSTAYGLAYTFYRPAAFAGRAPES